MVIIPPSSFASSRDMESPNPVPPNLRLVEPSACWKASNMRCCFSGGIPRPVSTTARESVFFGSNPDDFSAAPSPGRSILSETVPFSVNLKALERKFLSTCSTRFRSVWIESGRPFPIKTSNVRPLLDATGSKVCRIPSLTSLRGISSTSRSIFPASTLERSRTSLISESKSEPEV